jgi:hypothetical protein
MMLVPPIEIGGCGYDVPRRDDGPVKSDQPVVSVVGFSRHYQASRLIHSAGTLSRVEAGRRMPFGKADGDSALRPL